jgi:GNAT superfamily N-acetyltransferase
MSADIKTTYTLEMLHPEDLRPVRISRPGLRIERMDVPLPEYNKFLHTVVGHDYRWGGRTDWSEDEWTTYADRVETWVAYVGGTPAGYFELEKLTDGSVEINSFGLLAQFIGQGLGGPLLTRAAVRAWEMGATRVWLHTCSHDHPHALNNYLARGFQVQETRQGPPNPPIPSFWELVEG